MAIALRGTPTTATTAASGTLTLNVPVGVVSGDVLFAIIEVQGTTLPATPTGLTQLDTKNNSAPAFSTFYRVCDGSEGASYSWTVANASAGTLRAYSGVSSGSPINVHGIPNRTTTTTATATTITTTVDNCMLVFVAAATGGGDPTSFTNPTGFANQAIAHSNSGVGNGAVSCDELLATAGATGNLSGTWGAGASGGDTANMTALAPAAPPTNTVAPAVTGSTTVGSTLTTDNGTWTNSPTSFSYQWKSNGVNVGTNQNTYVTQAGDVGQAVGCTVTATNADGSASQASNTVTVTGASLSTVIGKTGTSGSAVMQKAKASWTYITQKTGTSGTAVDQKGAGSYTKIKGH